GRLHVSADRPTGAAGTSLPAHGRRVADLERDPRRHPRPRGGRPDRPGSLRPRHRADLALEFRLLQLQWTAAVQSALKLRARHPHETSRAPQAAGAAARCAALNLTPYWSHGFPP